MRAMSLSIRSEPYDFFVMRLGLNSTKRCSPGLQVYATAMASGQNIGTMMWQDRHRSSPTNQEKEMFPLVFGQCMANAVNVTKGFTNTGSHESGRQEIRKSKRIRQVSFCAFCFLRSCFPNSIFLLSCCRNLIPRTAT